ncbi:MAG: hypothetical protein ACR2PX_27585 [Endozoicomonas sp.]|uniref:hypothetical protein n=1 Tax=Endozoicomonas sp. TaxID=1892382 RepID=UPI003D9BAC66
MSTVLATTDEDTKTHQTTTSKEPQLTFEDISRQSSLTDEDDFKAPNDSTLHSEMKEEEQ